MRARPPQPGARRRASPLRHPRERRPRSLRRTAAFDAPNAVEGRGGEAAATRRLAAPITMTVTPSPTTAPQIAGERRHASHQPPGRSSNAGSKSHRDQFVERVDAKLRSWDRTPVRAGAKHLVGDDQRSFGVDDLAHGRHEATSVRMLREVDDKVHGVSDQQVRGFEREALRVPARRTSPAWRTRPSTTTRGGSSSIRRSPATSRSGARVLRRHELLRR